MKIKYLFYAIVAIAIINSLAVAQEIPQLIYYQGNLTDASGNPLNGSYGMVFSIWSSATSTAAGDKLWEESHTDVPVNHGLFSIVLGSINPISLKVFSAKARYLEIVIQKETLTPRQQIVSTPYAYSTASVSGESNIFPSNGKVGIGTTSPTEKLEVVGTVHSKTGGFKFPDGTLQATAAAATGGNTLDQAYDQGGPGAGRTINADAGAVNIAGPDGLFVNGNVGIGITSPESHKFRVKSSSGSGHTGFLENINSANQFSTLYVKTNGPGYAVHAENSKGSAGYFKTSSTNINTGFFENTNSSNQYSTLYVKTNGSGYAVHAENINVNNRNAGYFNGNVEVTGYTSTEILKITGGSDLSEQFEVASEEMEVKPGMVVCIDEDNPGKLVISNKTYDSHVVGIISGAGGIETGMLMGQKNTPADGSYPVALTGRVYVWADASNEAISPGDLLTTSATPGYAMKVKHYDRAQGAILGKAMTKLETGQGLVLVLVSLQ